MDIKDNAATRSREKSSLTVSIFFAWVVVLFGLFGVTQTATDHQMMYVLLVVAAGIILGIPIYHILQHVNICHPAKITRPVSATISSIVFAIIVIASVHRYYTEEVNMESHSGRVDLEWYSIPQFLVAFVSVVAVLFVIFCLRDEKKSGPTQAESVTTFLCYGFVLIVYAYSLYAPNLLNNDSYHMTAALQSVYNTAFDIPFNVRTTGIYGHYAIFLWPFLKIFGHRPETVASMIAGVGVVCEALLIYAIHRTINSPVIRKVAALASALPIVSIYTRSYFQVYPLRIFPAVIIIAYVAWLRGQKRHIRYGLAVGYLLCAIAITWTTDAGLVATVAYTAWIVHRYGLATTKIGWKDRSQLFAFCLLGFLGAIAGMILIINLYNVLICRSEPILRACFFPFTGSDDFAQSLQLPLQWKNFSWLWVVTLFFVSTVVGLRRTILFGSCLNHESKLDFLFFCAVMGLGQGAYYLNRAAYYNLTVIMPEAALCMALLVENTLSRQREKESIGDAIQFGISGAILAELSVLAAATFLTAGDAIRLHVNSGHYDMSSLQTVAQQVLDRIPADTYAVGVGTQEIYAEIGWDPGYHQRDVTDFFGDGTSEITDEINTQHSLLLNADSQHLLYNIDDWVLADTIQTEKIILNYYIHK